jgi:hypothetical protein
MGSDLFESQKVVWVGGASCGASAHDEGAYELVCNSVV